QIIDVDSKLLGVSGIERVLGIDERSHTSALLCLGNDLQSNSGFAGRFRAEDLDDAPAGKASHAQCRVKRNRPGWNYGDRNDRLFRSEAHDRAFTELFFDLGE